MKLVAITTLSVVVFALSGVASEELDANANGTKFPICTNGTAACNLVVENLGNSHVAQAQQESEREVGQLLQTYVQRLSGVALPIVGLKAASTDGVVRCDLVLRTSFLPSSHGNCFTIGFARGTTGKIVEPPLVPRASLYVDADGPNCAKMALSNFVEKVFGPPLSAIDDPNYKWPHRPTLVIDAEKFETIKFPPDKDGGPRDLNPSDQK